MKKKVLAAVMAMVMTASLAACGAADSGAAAPAASGDSAAAPAATEEAAAAPAASGQAIEFHVAQDVDPGSMAPYGTEGPRNIPVSMVYQSLGNLSPDKQDFYLVLAKSVEETEPGVYDVEIYDYITDSQGNAFTADDVVFDFEQYAEQGFTPQYIASLDKVEKTGDYSVRITMKEGARAGAFETMLEKVRCFTKAAWDASPDQMQTTPVGTAPYILTEYASGQKLVFEKRADYWQTDESKINIYQEANSDKIVLDIITDRSTQAIALQAGQIEISPFIQGADLVNFLNDDLSAKDGYNSDHVLPGAHFQMVFNCSDQSPMADQSLREAVAYSIDAAQVIFTGYDTSGGRSYSNLTPYVADYDASVENEEYFEYDEAKAKELLEASGYNGETIRLLVDPNFPSASATLVASYMQNAGMNVEIMLYEQAMYQTMKADNSGTQYDIDLVGTASTGYGWSQTSDLDNTLHENGLAHIIKADDKLQELYENMAGVDTCSPEAAREFCDYVKDNCYEYGIGYKIKNIIAKDYVTTIAYNEWGDLVPGACVVNK